VVSQFAVAALSERWNFFRIQDRRSEAAATRIKLRHQFEKCIDTFLCFLLAYIIPGHIPKRRFPGLSFVSDAPRLTEEQRRREGGEPNVRSQTHVFHQRGRQTP